MHVSCNCFMGLCKKVLCLQETHLKRYSANNLTSNYGKNLLLYYSRHLSKPVNGVGIMIETNREVDSESISEIICKMVIKLDNQNYRLTILSANILCQDLWRVKKILSNLGNYMIHFATLKSFDASLSCLTFSFINLSLFSLMKQKLLVHALLFPWAWDWLLIFAHCWFLLKKVVTFMLFST